MGDNTTTRSRSSPGQRSGVGCGPHTAVHVPVIADPYRPRQNRDGARCRHSVSRLGSAHEVGVPTEPLHTAVTDTYRGDPQRLRRPRLDETVERGDTRRVVVEPVRQHGCDRTGDLRRMPQHRVECVPAGHGHRRHRRGVTASSAASIAVRKMCPSVLGSAPVAHAARSSGVTSERRSAPTMLPAEVPTMMSAVRGFQPRSWCSAHSTPAWNARPRGPSPAEHEADASRTGPRSAQHAFRFCRLRRWCVHCLLSAQPVVRRPLSRVPDTTGGKTARPGDHGHGERRRHKGS